MLEAILSRLSWQYAVVVAVVTIFYIFIVGVHRLFFHPLAKFPGPKLAALTRWYEAYYDIILEGQYEFRIQRMHEQYGPIVRISPFELHIKDPPYHHELFRFGARFDRDQWATGAHDISTSTVFTVPHDLHKQRRAPLNSYFSKARVGQHVGLIRGVISRLCAVMDDATETGHVTDIGAAASAWQRDVALEFILDDHPNNLGETDMGRGVTTFIEKSASVWRINKHLRWYGPLIMSIPLDFIIKYSRDPGMVTLAGHQKNLRQHTRRLMDQAASSSPEDFKGRTTAVHDIVWDPRLPPAEKTFNRVFDEVGALIGAAFETTASVLRVIMYHVWSQPQVLDRLRAELADAITAAGTDLDPDAISPAQPLDLRTLEQLPYLTGVLMEAMRMSPGLGSRMHRMAPDRDLVYGEWTIPAGTPVGMTQLDMHMDPEYFPEPKRFVPERWLEAEERKRLDKAYMPFSRGPRNCLGMHFAWAELYLVVAELVQRFDFEFHDVKDNHFDIELDGFTVAIYGKSVLRAVVKPYRA